MTDTDQTPPQPLPWTRGRYGFAAFWCLFLVIAWFVLRVVLYSAFKPSGLPAGDVVHAFLSGFYRDLFVALVQTLPLVAWFLIIPNHRFPARWHRILFLSACFIFCFVEIFLLFVEFFFFEEFKSRFNTVAVDYLIYPKEVFVNIWESYHVGIVILVCFVLAVAWLFAASKLFARMWEQLISTKARFAILLAAVALTAAAIPTLNFKQARISTDRTLNELANNGAISFSAAAWTHNLDYTNFYKTLPLSEAYARTRKLVAEPNTRFVEDGNSIKRQVLGDTNRPRLNLVILLEESLGSEFWGCLGRKKTLTPEMDKLAADEGMLFTNLYANGNRTVRGMEGVLSSFPSLPGDSIVKRDRSDDVETLARVLKRDGYSTTFLYGGRGMFDGMRSYAVRNGYDRFIEQKHFAHPTFTTAWGVCDEDIFARCIEEFRELNNTGKPFFGTVLSVSNHRPYTYPKGRIPEDPDKQYRIHAVKYSDYSLGQFFKAARKEAFWTNTIFAVIADHGARVYGKQSIPIHSYEIPLLIAGPAVIKEPGRIGQLGCSLDVGPTLLGLIGRPYETMFFGRDLLKMCNVESGLKDAGNSNSSLAPSDGERPGVRGEGRVFLNHNRDIGMLAHERMVVLGLMQTDEFYQGDPKHVEMTPLPQPTDADLELEKDAIAIYQVADDLYMHQRYHLD